MKDERLEEIRLLVRQVKGQHEEYPFITDTLIEDIVPELLAEVGRLREQVAWLETERARLKDELGEDDHSGRFDVPGLDY